MKPRRNPDSDLAVAGSPRKRATAKTATKPRYARAARPQVDAVEKERGYLDALRRIHDTGIIVDVETT